jgi:hypothetical protein
MIFTPGRVLISTKKPKDKEKEQDTFGPDDINVGGTIGVVSGNVLWGVDKQGNPILKSVDKAKASFPTLNKNQLASLKQAMGLAGYTSTSVPSQRSFWNLVIDNAAFQYKKNPANTVWGAMAKFAENQALTGGSNSGRGGPSGPQVYTTITDSGTAIAALQRNAKLLIGREVTKAEASAYVKKLNAGERAAATVTTQTGSGSTTVQKSFDGELFTLNYLIGLAGGKFDEGRLGSTLDGLKDLANDYGIESVLTPNQYKKYTKELLLGETDTDAIRKKFAKSAASLYSAFRTQILDDPATPVKELVSDYIGAYANLYDVDEDSVKVSDVLTKASPSGLDGNKAEPLSLNDYRIVLRNDERFQTTSTAKREAAQLGSALARMAGVNI